MSVIDKAKAFYSSNKKLAIGIAVAAAVVLGVMAYFGDSDAAEPVGYPIQTPAFCTSAEVVKVGFSEKSKENVSAFFSEVAATGICIHAGGPIPVHMIEIVGELHSEVVGDIAIIKLLVDGYESEGFVYWAMPLHKARQIVRGI